MSTDKKTINWYNENAKKYSSHVNNPADSIYHAYYEKPAMHKLIPDIQGKQVLSLGCGSGEDSNHLKKLGAKRSVGIDIAEELIKIAKASHTECEFHTMDMEQLNFQDEEFDFAYSSLAIGYIENWTRVLHEVFRVLKPNSYFLFSCQHPLRSTMVETRSDENGYEKQISIIKDKNSEQYKIIGDYLHARKLEAITGNIMMVTGWHKPLSEIINTAVDAGFSIDRLVEPQPTEEMKNISPQTHEKLSKIPEFMILRLKKG
jgi:ubiquinone/menaquinone biosynthesis C-methylase UbiE